MSRQEEVKRFAENLTELEVTFTDKLENKKKVYKFYSYETFGKWIADNYDAVDILEVVQSEE